MIMSIQNGGVCVTGSRDHSLAVWNISTLVTNEQDVINNNSVKTKASKFIREAHKVKYQVILDQIYNNRFKYLTENVIFQGWIWTLDSYKSLVSSGSWDKRISIRDLNDDFKQVQTLKLDIYI